ncbi:MAG: hypothetical protein SFX74_11175, partial [Fimbriimonadaceae bacterium]|nr:hypothetical protein [Fimbriimonadaceae bacterium]
IFTTFIGGSGDETVSGSFTPAAKIAPGGAIVVAVTTNSTDLETTGSPTPLQAVKNGNYDGYLIRLDPLLGSFQRGTYFGGPQYDSINAFDINPINGDIAIGLSTRSLNLGSGVDGTAAALNYHRGTSAVAAAPGTDTNGFIAVIDRDLSRTKFGTYYGGNRSTQPYSLTYGRGYESVVIGGSTRATNMTWNAGSMNSGDFGAFVSRFSLGAGPRQGLPSQAVVITSGIEYFSRVWVDQVHDRVYAIGRAYGTPSNASFNQLAAHAAGFQKTFPPSTQMTRGVLVRFRPEVHEGISGWSIIGSSGTSETERLTGLVVLRNGTMVVSGYTTAANPPMPTIPGGTNLSHSSGTWTAGCVYRIPNGFTGITHAAYVGDRTTTGSDAAGIVAAGPYEDIYVVGSTSRLLAPAIPGFTPHDSVAANFEPFIARIAYSTDPVLLRTTSASPLSGERVDAILELNAHVVDPAGQRVTFTSSNPAVLRLQGGPATRTMVIPRNQDRAAIKMLAESVSEPTAVTISATSSGTTRSSVVTVLPQ